MRPWTCFPFFKRPSGGPARTRKISLSDILWLCNDKGELNNHTLERVAEVKGRLPVDQQVATKVGPTNVWHTEHCHLLRFKVSSRNLSVIGLCIWGALHPYPTTEMLFRVLLFVKPMRDKLNYWKEEALRQNYIFYSSAQLDFVPIR